MLKDLNLVGGMTNIDWLNQFHDEMRMHKITQGQLAKTADYSRSHLNQLLTGKSPINKQAQLRLTLALRSLTGLNNIDVCVDYLGVTSKSHDYEELVTELFQINLNHFNLKEGARYGYAATFKCGEIDVLLSPYQDVNADGYNPSEDSGTMIELKAKVAATLNRICFSRIAPGMTSWRPASPLADTLPALTSPSMIVMVYSMCRP